MVYYYLFDVFSILVNYYFEVSFHLKEILYVAKTTQTTVAELL